MKKSLNYSLILLTILALALFGIGCDRNQTDNGNDVDKEPAVENQEVDRVVTLYFSDDQAMYLVPEKRIIEIEENAEQEKLVAKIVEELIVGPENQTLIPTIPPETKLRAIEIENDLVKVDFSREIQTTHWGGSTGELMTVNTIVNSITELDGINKVLILVEGEIQESLIGHLYTKEPFERDEKVIKGL